MKSKLFNVLTAVILFLMPNANFGQAPTLGTTSGFALFTAVGAFSNIGAATYVTGDVGTNVGAFNAFPPGTVVGSIHVADPASTQAAIDVATAYSDLSEVTCGPVLGVTLGNNQVLTPNVYCIGAASTLTGDLILDGQGDPNALFIIKINGALSTSTFSNVILIDSASLCNVYWQINGAFTLGDSSVFRGTIVANGAISLLEGSTLLGRGLSRAGAIDLHNNFVAIGMQPIVTITGGGNTTLCSGGSVTLTASVTNGLGPFSYLWSPGGQTTSAITVSPTVTTTYTVGVSALNGCSAGINTIVVTVNPVLTVDLGNDTVIVICVDDSLLLDAGVTGAYYSWSTGATTQTIFVTTTGVYYVDVTNGIGCSASDTIKVVVYGTIHLDPGPDTTVCGCILLDAYVSGATSYQWCSGGTYPSKNVCITGVYCVTVSNGVCLVSDTIRITVNQPPVVNLGSDATVTISSVLNAGNTGASFLWNTGSTTQMITITSSGQYYVIVTDTNGCTGSDTINVSVLEENINAVVHIPEGFSPNGDGINDRFVIRGIENYPGNTIIIFNRWGNKLFQVSPYQNTWDGRSTTGLSIGGDQLPTGTYFYLLDLGNGSAIYKGTIYLNR